MLSASFPITPAPRAPGAPRPSRRSTTRTRAISSPTCIACSNQTSFLRPGPPERRRMARRIGRSQWAQEAIGFGLATYLSFVRSTNRFTTVPEDVDAYIKDDLPLIAAMWHGQHLMMPFARPVTMDRLAVLISRHEDAGAQALAAERLGITPVRGSGGPADRNYYKGGVPAIRELLRQLGSGS